MALSGIYCGLDQIMLQCKSGTLKKVFSIFGYSIKNILNLALYKKTGIYLCYYKFESILRWYIMNWYIYIEFILNSMFEIAIYLVIAQKSETQ